MLNISFLMITIGLYDDKGGALSVTVIVETNRIGDPCSNLDKGVFVLLCTYALEKGMNPCFPSLLIYSRANSSLPLVRQPD